MRKNNPGFREREGEREKEREGSFELTFTTEEKKL